MVKPSRRREMAQRAVSEITVSIRLACLIFSISETCYRYQAKLSHVGAWAAKHDIKLDFIQPSNPQQNAYIERYNRTVRYDWLAQYLFESIGAVQDYATQWLWHYNNERPNMGLGGITTKQKLAIVA